MLVRIFFVNRGNYLQCFCYQKVKKVNFRDIDKENPENASQSAYSGQTDINDNEKEKKTAASIYRDMRLAGHSSFLPD